MNIEIDIPEEFAQRLQTHWGNLSRRSLEAVAVEAYREGVLTAAEVGRLLGHTSRWQTDEFLQKKQAYLHCSQDDLAEDTAAIRDLIDP